jgi:hypothetical protein
MDEMLTSTTGIVAAIVAIIGALGVKEFWKIWQRKIEINAESDHKSDERLTECENKIEELRVENTNLKVKVAKLEERLLVTTKTRVKNAKKAE